MDRSRVIYLSLSGLAAVLLMLLFAGCGGGGGTALNPQPPPGQQQPPTDPQADPPDTSSIVATVNIATNVFQLNSGPNAAMPNATVFLEDSQSFCSDSKTAGADSHSPGGCAIDLSITLPPRSFTKS